MSLRTSDAHCHANPIRGALGPRALARKFSRSGGWFLCLVNLPSWSYGLEISRPEDYAKMYELTIKAAREVEEEGVRAAAILGPHPAELAKLVRRGKKPGEAATFLARAYDIAAEYVRRGLAVGLGEVGRPHWDVPRSVVEACNEVLDYVLVLSRDLDCIVHLHLERRGLATLEDVERRVKKGGAKRIILHHAEAELVAEARARGLYPSVPARLADLGSALAQGPCFIVESDYLDDPRRPGAVVAPWSISRTAKRLLSRGAREEDLRTVFVENIRELYRLHE